MDNDGMWPFYVALFVLALILWVIGFAVVLVVGIIVRAIEGVARMSYLGWRRARASRRASKAYGSVLREEVEPLTATAALVEAEAQARVHIAVDGIEFTFWPFFAFRWRDAESERTVYWRSVRLHCCVLGGRWVDVGANADWLADPVSRLVAEHHIEPGNVEHHADRAVEMGDRGSAAVWSRDAGRHDRAARELEAMALYELALEEWLAGLDALSGPDLAERLVGVAVCCRAAGRNEEVAAYLARAASVAQSTLERGTGDADDVARMLGVLGACGDEWPRWGLAAEGWYAVGDKDSLAASAAAHGEHGVLGTMALRSGRPCSAARAFLLEAEVVSGLDRAAALEASAAACITASGPTDHRLQGIAMECYRVASALAAEGQDERLGARLVSRAEYHERRGATTVGLQEAKAILADLSSREGAGT